jgi:hypothetical protein
MNLVHKHSYVVIIALGENKYKKIYYIQNQFFILF